MNFKLFKIFLTVCKVGNMTHAAKELYMTQPSVSQAIVELEKNYGVRLFERLNHRLYLTAAGERLRSYAQHILNLSEQARKELADLSRAGTVRIGASLTIGAYLLPELVAGFHRQYPEIEVFSLVDNTALIEERILTRTNWISAWSRARFHLPILPKRLTLMTTWYLLLHRCTPWQISRS